MKIKDGMYMKRRDSREEVIEKLQNIEKAYNSNIKDIIKYPNAPTGMPIKYKNYIFNNYDPSMDEFLGLNDEESDLYVFLKLYDESDIKVNDSNFVLEPNNSLAKYHQAKLNDDKKAMEEARSDVIYFTDIERPTNILTSFFQNTGLIFEPIYDNKPPIIYSITSLNEYNSQTISFNAEMMSDVVVNVNDIMAHVLFPVYEFINDEISRYSIFVEIKDSKGKIINTSEVISKSLDSYEYLEHKLLRLKKGSIYEFEFKLEIERL